ncbi:MAG: metallophosphatase family protein [Firmicutes bacterium]|nr:metallophosphatase family protein [Bacillota bacterium]
MRYAILSDVHANLEALEAVLEDARQQGVERLVCLGDFVGYGPDPNACVERLRGLLVAALVGNHDLAALGRLDARRFNLFARAAVEWTREQLSPSVRAYLEGLEPRQTFEGMLLVHASPQDPVEEYILDWETADDNFRAAEFSVCLFGHTHVPVRFAHDGVRTYVFPLAPNVAVKLERHLRHLINVGSVGQPRDGDPRAAYVVLDTGAGTMELRRVMYPVEAVQAKMQARGLPRPLWERLSEGR